MIQPTLRPRKNPRQARASQMVETILQAAARVLSRHALAGFNTNRVAEVAGISVGSVYQYFPNKSAMVAALIERAQNTLAQGIEHAVAQHQNASLQALLLGLIDVALEHQFGDAVLASALDHEEQRLPLIDVLQAAQERIVKAVHGALRHHPELVAQPPNKAAVADCLTIAKALIEAETGLAKPNSAALRQRVLRALSGYLLAAG